MKIKVLKNVLQFGPYYGKKGDILDVTPEEGAKILAMKDHKNQSVAEEVSSG